MKANSKKPDGSGNQDLIDHLFAVGNVAAQAAHPALKDVCQFAGDWHDVGKAVASFQKIIKKADLEETTFEKYAGPLHHEVSWALLLILDTRRERVTDVSYATWGVYFHHVTDTRPKIPNGKFENALEIIKYLREKEPGSIEACLDLIHSIRARREANNPLWKQLHPTSDFWNVLPDVRQNVGSVVLRIPTFGDADQRVDKRASYFAARSWLVAADRFVSQMTRDECKKCALTPPAPQETTRKPLPLSLVQILRDEEQLKLADTLISSRLSECNELTGFGKTRVGVLAFARSEAKQLIFLVPRSSLVTDRYVGINKELKALGLICSVEAIWSSSRRLSTDPEIPVGESDIVIATVDTYLLAQMRHGRSHRFADMLSSMLIVDEYHEAISEHAIFATTVLMLSSRKQYATAPTLLMSATPAPIWGYANVPPEDVCHPPVNYDRKGDVEIDFSLVDGLPPVPVQGEICYTNSVGLAQHLFDDSCLLTHSRYTATDRVSMLEEVGTYSSGTANRPGVISTPILQSGYDISFSRMTLIEPQPHAVVQCVGRYDRQNTGQGRGVTIIRLPTEYSHTRSEKMARPRSTELCNKFIELLFNGKSNVRISRSALHGLFAKFITTNGRYRVEIENLWRDSQKALEKINLGRGRDLSDVESVNTDEIRKAGGSNPIRGESFQYTMRDKDTNKLLNSDNTLSFFVYEHTEAVGGMHARLKNPTFEKEAKGAGFTYKKSYKSYHAKSVESPVFLEEYVYDRRADGSRGLGAIKNSSKV